MFRRLKVIYLLMIISLSVVIGCGSIEDKHKKNSLKIVASTSMVGDVVRNVIGDTANLSVLLPPGIDPHGFEAVPSDAALIADADVIFLNGLGLEDNFKPLLSNVNDNAVVLSLSDGLPGILLPENETESHHDHDHGHVHQVDPHSWMDPKVVARWVARIEKAMIKSIPGEKSVYLENGSDYITKLDSLDKWITEQVEKIPEKDRIIVADHNVFGWFAKRYGFKVAGAIIPGYSTLAEPSAKELAEIVDTISELSVKAVFVGKTVNPTIAERVADDTGTKLVPVYTGSLGEPGSLAENYIDYMKYNVRAICDALGEN